MNDLVPCLALLAAIGLVVWLFVSLWRYSRRLFWAVFIPTSALSVAIVAVVWYVAWWHLKASERHNAVFEAVIVIEEYVKENDGQWPRSWEDLETVRPANAQGWPWSKDRLRSHLEIDFSFDPDTVGDGFTYKEFQAVRGNGPYFIPDEMIDSLLDTIRETRDQRAKVAPTDDPLQ